MRHNSINFRIPVYITVFAMVCVIIAGWISTVLFRLNMEEQIESKNMVISKMIASELDLYLNNALDTVVTAANFSSQSHGDLDKIEEEIFRMYDNFNYFDLIYFMNSEAKMVFSKPPNHLVEGRVYTDRDYYWDIMDDGKDRTVSALLISSVLNRPHFIIAAPVTGNFGEKIGLIGAGIPLENLNAIIEDVETFDGKVWIIDEKGSLVIHPDYVMGDQLIPVEALGIELGQEEDFEGLLAEQTHQNLKYTVEGETYYGSVSFVGDHGWMVVVEQNESKISKKIGSSLRPLLLLELVVLAVALVLGMVIARSITDPVSKLVNQVRGLPEELAKGKPLETHIFDDREDEITELSHAFDDMGNRLRKNINELEIALKRENHVQRYLNNILASVYSGIIVADQNGKITIVNEQAVRLSGYCNAVIPENIYDFLRILGIDIEASLSNLGEESGIYEEVETEFNTRAGNVLIISYTCTPVKDHEGKYYGFIFQFRDITRLKKIEEELRKEDRIHTIGELTASIIHDIGNPLAGMSNLLEILGDDEIDQVSKQEVLNLLVQEVNDLNVLVINFLDFAKSGDSEKVDTDLRVILKSIEDLFRKELRDRKITLVKAIGDEEYMVKVDARSIKQAIINIFKNAIEAVGEEGTIKLILHKDNRVMLSIEDDGIGMNDEEKEKLFYPFYTTKENGTGLGLFTAFTALTENDCSVEVDSIEGEGTSFKVEFTRLS